MLLQDKVAVIYGAGGAIGGAVARAFAREGARLYLSGRTHARVAAVAAEIGAYGTATAQTLDVLDWAAVDRYTAKVAEEAGGIDVAFNAMGFAVVQGTPLTALSVADFLHPITTWTAAQFLTARAAARPMRQRRQGVILTLSASTARLAIAGTGGFGVACAAIEGLTRTLSAELGPDGIRVVCLRPHRIGETLGPTADLPMDRDTFVGFLEGMTLLKRLPTLDDVAAAACFFASDRAAAMTATTANLTCGVNVD